MQTNFNPQNIMGIGGNQFSRTSSEQLLEQLRYMSAYGGHNPTTLMLLHELHARAVRSFGKTFVPTKEVQGDSHLYTSIFKGGLMHHFFVTDDETKQKIAQVVEQTTLDPKDGGPSHFGVERIGLLMELGDVFNVVTCDENGKQVGPIKSSGFAALFGGWGFDEQTKHSSKVLPVAVIELPTLVVLNNDRRGLINSVLHHAAQVIQDHDVLRVLDEHLNTTPVVDEYISAVTGIMRLNDVGVGHTDVTQIHLLPAEGGAPVKLLGGAVNGQKWDAGFIKREKYPHLFPNAHTNMHPNNMMGGFNGFGPAAGGPWY